MLQIRSRALNGFAVVGRDSLCGPLGVFKYCGPLNSQTIKNNVKDHLFSTAVLDLSIDRSLVNVDRRDSLWASLLILSFSIRVRRAYCVEESGDDVIPCIRKPVDRPCSRLHGYAK